MSQRKFVIPCPKTWMMIELKSTILRFAGVKCSFATIFFRTEITFFHKNKNFFLGGRGRGKCEIVYFLTDYRKEKSLKIFEHLGCRSPLAPNCPLALSIGWFRGWVSAFVRFFERFFLRRRERPRFSLLLIPRSFYSFLIFFYCIFFLFFIYLLILRRLKLFFFLVLGAIELVKLPFSHATHKLIN